MRNRDLPAGVEPMDEATGLTKREAAAIAAMQGMLANQHTVSNIHKMALAKNGSGFSTLAARAVDYADALFDELDGDKT